jgi:hypothetical protein
MKDSLRSPDPHHCTPDDARQTARAASMKHETLWLAVTALGIVGLLAALTMLLGR